MSVCRCVLSVVWLVALPIAVAGAQPVRAMDGADSPQAVVAGLQRAIKADDLAAAMPFISPAGRRELAREGVDAVLLFLAFNDPEDRAPGSTPPPKAERDGKRKSYRTAVDTARRALKPHGLDKAIGRPLMAPKTQDLIDNAMAKADPVALTTSLISLMDRLGPMLGMQKGDKPRVPFALGNVTRYRVQGDRATARLARETVAFERIDGRWYIGGPSIGSRR